MCAAARRRNWQEQAAVEMLWSGHTRCIWTWVRAQPPSSNSNTSLPGTHPLIVLDPICFVSAKFGENLPLHHPSLCRS